MHNKAAAAVEKRLLTDARPYKCFPQCRQDNIRAHMQRAIGLNRHDCVIFNPVIGIVDLALPTVLTGAKKSMDHHEA